MTLNQAIADGNRLWRAKEQIEVKAFGPEHLYPGVADYGQAVANRQLEDYDIYVGIWREKKGTATPVAPSGTLEELRNAFARYQRSRRPWILCYFWRHSPTDFIDVKNEITGHGGFYQNFDNPQHLAKLVCEHLTRYLASDFRAPGHSTTKVTGSRMTAEVPTLLFQIFKGGEDTRRTLKFERLVVAVGRNPEQNQIVLPDNRVHREQGLFAWENGDVSYIDIAGDSQIERRTKDAGTNRHGHPILQIGDSVLMPDGSCIVVRAIVDPVVQ